MKKLNFSLIEKAIQKNELFDFLVGKNGYEMRNEYAYMPTDTDKVAFLLANYIKEHPTFNVSLIADALLKISNSPEWSWLVIYYVSAFETNGLTFLPYYSELYKNVQSNKADLRKNGDWLCFNFKPKFNNLWDIIENENNNRLIKKYNVPKLE